MIEDIENHRLIIKRVVDSLLLVLLVVAAALAMFSVIYEKRPVPSTPTAAPVASSNTNFSKPEDDPVAPKIVTAPSDSNPDYYIPPVVNGIAPVISRVPTKEKVVFLGIDDGQNKQDFEVQLMQQYNIKASLFLANRFISDNPSFFNQFVPIGSLIEDHTMNHRLLSQLSYEEQKQEICGQADLEFKEFHRRPILFRPPGGDYNTDTPRAAAACGMKAVVLWIAKANGGSMQYQIGHSLQPGDIVLMHFRPEFRQDMQAFVDAETAAGLHTELLENWLAN